MSAPFAVTRRLGNGSGSDTGAMDAEIRALRGARLVMRALCATTNRAVTIGHHPWTFS
jgi:hypothetical protein